MQRPTASNGFTLIELLIVIGLISILAAFSISSVPRDRIQVNQETERLARSIDKARFDAVQRNNFVLVGVKPDGYCVLAVAERSVPFDRTEDVALLPDDPSDLNCSGGMGVEVVTNVPFGVGGNSRLLLAPSDEQAGASVAALTLLIDPRGIGQLIKLAGGTTISDGEFWIRLAHDSGVFRDVNVNRYGRTDQR